MKAIQLRTEYLENPIGIDIRKPRFYWNCEGGIRQTAYQIRALRNGAIIWDSGKVASAAMTHIPYEGSELHSRDMVTWQVCLWDEHDGQGEWAEATFEMGLLKVSDWTAKWISGDYKPKKKNTRYPVDCFLKEFSVKKSVKKARLYATARGVYDVTLNDTRIEDFILAPGMTDYRKRIQYQVYDVTAYLKQQNRLQLRLADGWFRGSVAAYGVINVFGTRTSVMAQLELEYEDGTREVVGTDNSFLWSNDGPIRFADLKDGEIYDAAKEPTYSGRAVEVSCDIVPTASNNVSVREREQLSVQKVTKVNGATIFDFGQNIAGYLAFRVKGKKGQQFKMTCGEVLGADDKVDMSGICEKKPVRGWSNLGLVFKLLGKDPKGELELTPKQEIQFTCSGKEDTYKTSFAVFGFRYVQMDGDISIEADAIKAIAVYSDMEQTGEFSCSNELVNKLYQNTVWSMKGNYLDLPTDCPTRERLGWTGDAQIFFDTGAYMMDTTAFFRKWMQDMEDNQYDNGLISAVLPYQGVEMMYKSTGSSVGWADAIYLIPYRYYKRFGDKMVLEQFWPMIRKYADYLMKNMGMCDKKAAKANPYNAYTYEKGVHLGEWLEPEEFRDKVYGAKAKHPEECTAYLHYSMRMMGEIAELLGDTAYEEKCREYAAGSKEAYNKLFVETGGLATRRQAKLVRPLALDLVDGKAKKMAQEKLVKAVEDYDYCVGTGFLSTPFILPVLTEAGRNDVAYKMLENTQKPGWLGEILDGATTIWENWEGDCSQNHYSMGAVCQWLFETVGGICPDGENAFIIKPVPGGTLTYANISYRSIYGMVKSSWKKNGEQIEYHIEIPANTKARIVLPDGTEERVEAGCYTYIK